jgi:uncharacterized protein YndB with AHSA1/START domain/DNA-binding transcriptional ArsR family regulator
MEEVFKALADPSRRQLLDRLNARNGQSLQELGSGLGMARQSVSKHLAVLEAANLVTTVRRGREKLHYLNAAPIHEIADRWINRYDRARAAALSDLKRALEETAMPDPKPEFVYTTYIRTTPERLWAALTEPAFTDRYWGCTLESRWKKGDAVTWKQGGATMVHPDQIVLDADPPRRLSYTWHTFTPEWAQVNNIEQERREAWAAEPRSQVTFDLEAQGEMVKLTVVHDGFPAGSGVLEGVRHGWPMVLSRLKTLVETGDVPAMAA